MTSIISDRKYGVRGNNFTKATTKLNIVNTTYGKRLQLQKN